MKDMVYNCPSEGLALSTIREREMARTKKPPQKTSAPDRAFLKQHGALFAAKCQAILSGQFTGEVDPLIGDQPIPRAGRISWMRERLRQNATTDHVTEQDVLAEATRLEQQLEDEEQRAWLQKRYGSGVPVWLYIVASHGRSAEQDPAWFRPLLAKIKQAIIGRAAVREGPLLVRELWLAGRRCDAAPLFETLSQQEPHPLLEPYYGQWRAWNKSDPHAVLPDIVMHARDVPVAFSHGAGALYTEALALWKQHKTSDALARTRTALELNPEHPSVLGLALLLDHRLYEWGEQHLSPSEFARIGASIERITRQGTHILDGDEHAQRCGLRWYGIRAERLYYRWDHRGWDEAADLLARLPAAHKKGLLWEKRETALQADRAMLLRILAGDCAAIVTVRDQVLLDSKFESWNGLLCTAAFWNATLAADPRPVTRWNGNDSLDNIGPWWRGITLVQHVARHGDPRAIDSVIRCTHRDIYSFKHVAATRLAGESINPFSAVTEPRLMRELLELGLVDVHARDAEGYGLLHRVERHGAVAEHLLAAGCPVDAVGPHGEHPIHRARSPGVVTALLNAGARLDVRNAKGQTPLEQAQRDRETYRSVLPVLRAASGTALPVARHREPPYDVDSIPLTALRAASQDLPAMRAALARWEDDEEIGLGKLLGQLDPPAYKELFALTRALELLPTPAATLASVTTDKRSSLDGFHVVVGDVTGTNAGDWWPSGNLLVIGSVTIAGEVYVDGIDCVLLITGRLTAEVLTSYGIVQVGDGIHAKGWVFGRGNDGMLVGDITSPVVMADDHCTMVTLNDVALDLSDKDEFAEDGPRLMKKHLYPGCLDAEGEFDAAAARDILEKHGSILKPTKRPRSE